MPANTHKLPLNLFSLWKDETSVEKRWNFFDFFVAMFLKIVFNACATVVWQISKFLFILLLTYSFALGTFRLIDSCFHDEIWTSSSRKNSKRNRSHFGREESFASNASSPKVENLMSTNWKIDNDTKNKESQTSYPDDLPSQIYPRLSRSFLLDENSSLSNFNMKKPTDEILKSPSSKIENVLSNKEIQASRHDNQLTSQLYPRLSGPILMGRNSSASYLNVTYSPTKETLKSPSFKIENDRMNFESQNSRNANEILSSYIQRPLTAGEENGKTFYGLDMENWRKKLSKPETQVAGLAAQKSLSEIICIEHYKRSTVSEASIIDGDDGTDSRIAASGEKRSLDGFSFFGEERDKLHVGRGYVNLQNEAEMEIPSEEDVLDSRRSGSNILNTISFADEEPQTSDYRRNLNDRTRQLSGYIEPYDGMPMEYLRVSSPADGAGQERSTIARAIENLKNAYTFVEESESRI